jgi:hypothetical protein
MKLAILLALIPTLALAGKPKEPEPTPVPTSNSASLSNAASNSHSDAAADAAAIAKLQADLRQSQNQAQNQRANADATGGQGVGQVDTSYQSSYDAKALAVSLAAIQAAPNASQKCIRHTRGGGNAAFSLTGGTKYDAECFKLERCLAIADRLAAFGYPAAAARQLVTCGGVTVDPVELVPHPQEVAKAEPKPEGCVTAEHLDRAFRACSSK